MFRTRVFASLLLLLFHNGLNCIFLLTEPNCFIKHHSHGQSGKWLWVSIIQLYRRGMWLSSSPAFQSTNATVNQREPNWDMKYPWMLEKGTYLDFLHQVTLRHEVLDTKVIDQCFIQVIYVIR